MPGLDQVQSTTLANGMKVIVWTDRDIPNVALYNWVRVGSRNEVPGITGLAHFFEHMMFNGTARRAPGEFDRHHGSAGRLQQRVHQRRRHRLPGLDPAHARSTWCSTWKPTGSRICRSTRRSSRANAASSIPSGACASKTTTTGFLVEQVQATAFVAHPYQIPTIGWPADIQGWKIEDLQKFFKTNYAPNNCTLILVGDVSAEEGFALAKKYLEPIPRQEPPPPVRTTEPEQLGEKRVFVQREAQTPLLHYAYKSPAANDPQGPAINLLMSVLTEGNCLAPASAAGGREEARHRSRRRTSRKGSIRGSRGCSSRCPKARKSARWKRRWTRRSPRWSRRASPTPNSRARRICMPPAFWKQLATINGKARLLGQFEVFEGDYQKLFDSPACTRR